ncbi:AraC family transcriptional regulator [Actinoplanes sp. NPDC024001]|uniref:helix-turn-helix transcriptional regulator n=1 Tax=Actinoplanes sp. NPDC024001 TaxID=3154598 RepID=UPI0033D14449
MMDTATLDHEVLPFAEWGNPPHAHDEHLFLYVPLGRIVITVAGREYPVDGSTGLWVPAKAEHSGWFSRDALIISELFDAWEHRLPHGGPASVEVTAFARERLLARHRIGVDDLGDTALFTLLAGLRGSRLSLPEPRSPIARAVARRLAEAPEDQRTATEWAALHYTSSTSLRRAFRAETGLAFTEWRTRLRLNHSLDLLAKGMLVGAVAARVGFTSANGYILAFRRHFGETPGAYIAGRSTPGGTHHGQLQDS